MSFQRTLFVALFTSSFVLAACGGPTKAARRVLVVSAHALDFADIQVSQKYEDASETNLARTYTEAVAQSLTELEATALYRSRMEPFDAAESAIRIARSSLILCEQAIDIWEESKDAKDFLETLEVLADSLKDVRSALEDVGVMIPDSLASALAIVEGFSPND